MRRRFALFVAIVLIGVAFSLHELRFASPHGNALESPFNSCNGNCYTGEPIDLAISSSSLDGAVLDTQVGTLTTISLASDVFFDFDKATLTPASSSELDAIAQRLQKQKLAHIDGYTDSLGRPDYNLDLSQRRADSVRSALASHLSSVELVTEGHGADNPVVSNTMPDGSDNPAGRAKNRRVTITFGPS